MRSMDPSRKSHDVTGPEVSVILPIYNEEPNLRPLIAELDGALAQMNLRYEIIAVDDGSTDGSRRLLRELASEYPSLRGLFFRRNAGQTAAFDAGFREVRGNVVVTMDADLQNDPRDIPRMVEKLGEGFDFVSGWRKDRKDSLIRTFPSRIANLQRAWPLHSFHELDCEELPARPDHAHAGARRAAASPRARVPD